MCGAAVAATEVLDVVRATGAVRGLLHEPCAALVRQAEAAGPDGTEWQWTKKVATLAFKNPKKDSVFYFDLDSPGKNLHGDQQVQVEPYVDTSSLRSVFVLLPATPQAQGR